MSEIDNEVLLTFKEAASVRWLPRRRAGRKPHISWFYRMATQGSRGVKLESRMVGSTRCTSEGALRRFFRRLSDLPAAEEKPTTANVVTQHQAAERELEAAGI
jgi:hypothetical protein